MGGMIMFIKDIIELQRRLVANEKKYVGIANINMKNFGNVHMFVFEFDAIDKRVLGRCKSHPDGMAAPNKSLCRPPGPGGCCGWGPASWSSLCGREGHRCE